MKHSVRSGNVSISYSVEGKGKETVLLIMGLGGRAADWGERFPEQLAERYRVVRMDNRGTGSSTASDEPFTLEDLAADAVKVLDAVDAARAHVVGVSMGGMIAQLVGLEHASRCRSLVLLSTHFGGLEVVPPTPQALELFQPPRGTTPEAITRRSMITLTAPGFARARPDVIEDLVRAAVREPTSRRVFSTQLNAILASDRSSRLADLRVPTLVVHGDKDLLIPVDNGRSLAARIPGSRLVILDDCGHFPASEKAEPLADLVLGFFAEHEGS